MSSVDDRLDSLASPARARSLLTVRAAISSAVSSLSPRSSTPSLMCSYWRSRFLLQACCGMPENYPPPPGGMSDGSSPSAAAVPRSTIAAAARREPGTGDVVPLEAGQAHRERGRHEGAAAMRR